MPSSATPLRVRRLAAEFLRLYLPVTLAAQLELDTVEPADLESWLQKHACRHRQCNARRVSAAERRSKSMAAVAPKFVTSEAVKQWLFARGLAAGVGEMMQVEPLRREEWIEQFDIPAHVAVALTGLVEREGEKALGPDVLDSLPFVSLCRGVLLPLSAMAREKARGLFGLTTGEPVPSPPAHGDAAAARTELVEDFFRREIGLTVEEKVALLLGEPYGGRKGGFRRDSLFNVAASLALTSRSALAERLTRLGDPAAVVAELRPVNPPVEPPDLPLSAREVMLTLRALPGRGRSERTLALRSLFARTGRVEAYFLARLLMRYGVPGFDWQSELLARLVAERFGVDAEAVATAAALVSLPEVAHILQREGEAGLRRIRLQPLLAFRPALAGPAVDETARYPLWVERKYDGVRLLLHKETDAQGNVLVAAFTRRRNDWTELVPGIEAVARALPARRVILDGELYALLYEQGQMRPAPVYELHTWLTGDRRRPLNLRYVAFDLIYLDGYDLTTRPLSERRQALEALLRPLAGWPLPLPVNLSEGQLAATRADLNRLFQFFRKQGYEGVVAKDPTSPYHLGRRERTWMKLKPELTLDLTLIGGFYTMGGGGARGFGSYLLGARGEDGQSSNILWEAGDVAGVDQERTQAIVSTLFAQGLLSGQKIERVGPTGLKQGQAFQPGVVVTVKFEGIVRAPDGRLSLRDPKIVSLRPDKSVAECDQITALEAIHLSERLG
jgi:DNA ligase-1